jgi:hypothetical protein
MTVRELIEALQELDPDAEVFATDNHEEGRPGSAVVDGQFEGHSAYAVTGAEDADDGCVIWLGPQ